jgi:hypothetical protein
LIVLVAGIAACGGSEDDPVGTGPVFIGLDPDQTSQPVMGAPLAESSTDSANEVTTDATPEPTSTPPSKTIDEEVTGRLVDELSFNEYPRSSARDLEREFRKSPETANQKIGKQFVVQGDVLEAGDDAAVGRYVSFKAGLGRVTCVFEVITEAELRRFTPDGTNAVVGTIESWDADNRVLTLKDCRVVIGF